MDMLNDCDIALYKAACNTNHCLNHLFKPKQRFHDMILRPRGHNYSLPKLKCQTSMNSFINRSLFALYKLHNVLVYIVKLKCYVNRIGECG